MNQESITSSVETDLANARKSSAFFKPSVKRGLSLLGTSGLVLGMGVVGTTTAAATSAPFACEAENTLVPAGTPTQNREAIEELLIETPQICLDGVFQLDDQVDFIRNVQIYGIGDSSIDADSLNGAFLSDFYQFGSSTYGSNYLGSTAGLNNSTSVLLPLDADTEWFAENFSISPSSVLITLNDGTALTGVAVYDGTAQGFPAITFQWSEAITRTSEDTYPLTISVGESDQEVNLHDIMIQNLTITGAGDDPAVVGNNVLVSDSTFADNTSGAVKGFSIDIENSTFRDNSSDDSGAAVHSSYARDYFESQVTVTNSTFIGNTADHGGAISGYAVGVENSTFIDNEATTGTAEGGAIYAFSGFVEFSTFVNNMAGVPIEPSDSDPDPDTPGNAIYKDNSVPANFYLSSNIFSGSSSYPQLGTGTAVSDFLDLGYNVFSTATEEDLLSSDTSVFGKSLSLIFGTSSPVLDSYAPNSNGTQTIALAAGSPALGIVDTDDTEFDIPDFDQRGAARTMPADAGSFEGTFGLATTGTTTPWWAVWSSAALLAIGGLAVAMGRSTKGAKTSI